MQPASTDCIQNQGLIVAVKGKKNIGYSGFIRFAKACIVHRVLIRFNLHISVFTIKSPTAGKIVLKMFLKIEKMCFVFNSSHIKRQFNFKG